MSEKKIITDANLDQFFLDKLVELNIKSLKPLNHEILFYSARLLNRFSSTQNFNDDSLGLKFLESIHQKKNLRDNYKEIAETSLFLCGYFSHSFNSKLIDICHYQRVGISAYERLDKHIPNYMGIRSFYGLMSKRFESVSELLAAVASRDQSDPLKQYKVS